MRIFLLALFAIIAQGQTRILSPMLFGDVPNTPTDSPGAGTYGSTQSVTLSDASASTILYTTNGSTPACPVTGTLYTGAISVSVTTTIKAIGCNGVTGGGVLTSVYTISGASVTLSAHAIDASCPTGTTPCTFTKTLTTGHTEAVYFGYCTSLACNTADCAAGTAVTDGTNTYTEVTAAAVDTNAWRIRVFVAPNVTGGSQTISIACNGGQTFRYLTVELLDLSGANATTPVDSSVSNSGTGTSASPSLTSAGNVSASGEILVCYTTVDNSLTFTGSFGQIDTDGGTVKVGDLVNPSSGATATCSGTQTSGAYFFSMIGIKP